MKANPRNPRKMSAKKLEALSASLVKFGDLSGFVYNRRTKTLISGHQKQKVIPPDSQTKIVVKHETPTKSYTIAEGFVMIDGESFKYREVDAPEDWEVEALLAANKHSGEWDDDLLRLIAADNPKLDWNLAGFELKELDAIGALPKLKEIVVKSGSDEEADADYIRQEEKTDEQIPTERPPEDVVAAFDSVEEKLETKNTRHIIIIDCPSEEKKLEVKEKLRTDKLVEQYGVRLL